MNLENAPAERRILPQDEVNFQDRGDVGRQPGKPQEGVEIGCRHVLFLSDIVDAELGVLDQAGLDVVRPGKDSEQARIGRRLVIGILDQHAHFAPGPLQACRHSQGQWVSRWIW